MITAMKEEIIMPRAFDKLIWTALTNAAFCERILNGCRRELLATLDLTSVELETVLAVQADTLEEFAEALCRQSEGPSP
jgi:hypothetical protein